MANWYVDNEIGIPGDGSSPANASVDIKTVVDGGFASGDTMYIKANATPYTGSRNSDSFALLDNITIDRYPTDTGTSRPVLDRLTTDGPLMIFGNNDNVTILNIHFIGSQDTSPPATYPLINFNAGACTDFTFEYCIFECQEHQEIFEFTSGDMNGLTIRYCHFISDDNTVTRYVLKNVASTPFGNITFQYNLVENFKYPFYLYYNTAARTITFDHNTLIGCGGDTGDVFNLGPDLDADFVINNNVFDGSTAPSVSNVISFSTPDAGSLSEDYNDYYGYDTIYSGGGAASHVPGIHNMTFNPNWTGGASTWEDARIVLTTYYAPLNTNEDMTEGDDSGSCLGAIFVATYVPPPPTEPETLTLDYPTNQNGAAFSCVNNAMFTRLKKHLVDDNIYDTSPSAVGITNRTVSFNGNVGDTGATLLVAYQIYKGTTQEIATITPNTDGSYKYSVHLPHGKAAYYVKSNDGAYSSNQIHINSYNIHVWLCAYAIEFLDVRDKSENARQNAYVADSVDFDGNVIQTAGHYLTRNFGQFISSNKLESMTRAEYQQMLIDVLSAYNLGPSIEALDLICKVFTNQIPSYDWYRNRVTAFPPADISVNLRVVSPPSLIYEWDETEVYLYDRRWLIPAGSGTVLGGADTYVFVDGTSPAGIDNQLSMLVSAAAPERYTMNWAETISSGLVQVDTNGNHTGVSGELYVTTGRYPEALNGASGSVAEFTTGIPGALLVLNTSHVDLNIAQETIDKTTSFGDVSIVYDTNYEYITFGLIGSNATEITGIVDCGRIDGSGAVARDAEVHHHCGELRIHGSLVLSTAERSDLFQTLKDVKPAHKFFHIMMENAATGALEYYGTI